MKHGPHGVNRVVVGRGGVGIDRDPLFVWLVTDAVVRRDVVGPAVTSRDPARRLGRAMRVHRYGDNLSGYTRIGLLGAANAEVMRAVGVVVELIAEHELVVVAVAIERADRVGVVGPTLIAGNMALRGPGLAAIERFVKTEQVVVPL